jgi:type I restriction enzyme S subunit
MSFPKYPQYAHEKTKWLGAIPANWSRTRLKYVVDERRRVTYGIVQAGPHVEHGIPYVRPADMSDENGVLDSESILKTSREIAGHYERSSLKTGDLVCSIGPSFGKVMVVPNWLAGGNLTQGTARIAVSTSNAPRFIFWCLRSRNSFEQWESSVGGATFRALNLGPLEETILPSPSKSEQLAIAEFLDRETAKIDALIAEQQRLIELLKERRSALITAAVTGQIDVRGLTNEEEP